MEKHKERDGAFGTVLGCMDGRCQEKATAFAKQLFGVDYVDTITEPGIDKLLAGGSHRVVRSPFLRWRLRKYLKAKATISAQGHGSKWCLIMGHCGCAGNPVSLEAHVKHLKRAQQRVEGWQLFSGVRAAVFDEGWKITEIKN
jgi:hypothetical protein